jgi:hypothetical protein
LYIHCLSCRKFTVLLLLLYPRNPKKLNERAFYLLTFFCITDLQMKNGEVI